MPQSTRNSLRQTVISWFLLILLVFIAVAIGFKQKSYQKSGSDSAILSADLFAGNFTAAEDIENYNSKSLYEKIDGKDDLYLSNGFISLQCRRFTDNSVKDREAEVYLYDMADGENAFAVYSLQKRNDSTPLDWTQFGYSASDSVYAAFGKYYMEIILSSQDNSLLTSALNAAKKLSSAISAGKTQMPVFDLFPTDNLIADSFKFINADAFSCSDLKNIFTANYKISGNDITAYLSKNNPADTYAKYYRFLIDNGAKDLQHTIKLPDSKTVELFGTNEIFFVTGGFFAGVRASAPIDDLQKLAEKLIQNLPKK
ncbi:MAG: hypothetical protein NTW93_02580 [Phycisphaerae bacterium]|nr:hypothetical protein [Phycisphaerae bacterium]